MAVPYNALLSTTLKAYVPKLADNIFKKYVLLEWIQRKVKVDVRGGSSIFQPVLYGKNNTVATYSGYDPIGLTPQEGITAAEYYWAQMAGSVAISGIEEAANKGEKQIVNLLQSKVKQTERSMAELLNTQLLSNTVNGGNGSKNFNGIDGLFADAATGPATVGGLAVADVPTWVSSQNGNATTGAGSLTIAMMKTQYNNVGGGPEGCDFIITTQALQEKYESLLQPNVRYVDTDTANAGFDNVTLNGAPVVFDSAVTTGRMHFLSSAHTKFSALDGKWFETTDFVRPENMDARYALIILYGQLWTDERRKGAKLFGAT